jgi:hypothetical protein
VITDYLAAESLIVARLRAQVSGVPSANVMTTADLAGVEARAQRTPALHVIYNGDEPAGVAGQSDLGDSQVVQQRWMIVVAVRSGKDTLGGSGARSVAGPLMVDVIQALAGWRPSADHGPLIRGSAPAPLFEAGFAYYPQLYRCAIVL